ncbi:hypothetical protein [Specibacter sp. RAF43]|uniref:hypothetical protein n=1 Tax=Specibacter sp. RAF43 TaxID=3233057 RepID=UPI003F959A00
MDLAPYSTAALEDHSTEAANVATSPAPDPYGPGGEWHYAESLKGRIFMITTDWVHPDTGDVIITPAKVAEVVARKGNLRTAWVSHDKDLYTAEDLEVNPRSVVGQPKPGHAHIVEERRNVTSVAAVARAYGVAPNFVQMKRGHGVFLDLVEYLTHEHPTQQALGKHRYHDSEIQASFGFRIEVDEHVESRSVGGKKRSSKILDQLMLAVMHGEKTLRQLRKENPLEYARNLRKFHDLRRDFMLSSPPPSIRVNYYIHGHSGTGKSVLARMLARALYPDLDPEECYYDAGDPKVMAQNYGGQPVMILDDYRPGDLTIGFGSRTSVWRAFDTSPGRADVNIKHGSVRMVQAVNIVTGVVPYREFLTKLAGSYKGADGTEHEAEDDRQAFRRFPFVAEVTSETFDFYANEGFFDGTDEYREFRQLFTMKCSMRKLAVALDSIESEEGKEAFRVALGDKVLGGMIAAHRDVRPRGSLLAADAIAGLDTVELLTGTAMEADKATRAIETKVGAEEAAAAEAARWEVSGEGTATYTG